MSIKCLLGFHDWEGCKCSLCGKIRDEQHDWSNDCEECSKCGQTRTDTHDWSKNCEKCSICGKTRDDHHKWNGCKCSVCEKVRDQLHNWDGCKCAFCEKVRDEQHKWDGCTCSVCGRILIGGGHEWSGRECKKCGYIKPEMILLEGGTFINENKIIVSVSSFYIGKYPVTQKEYEMIIGYNPSCFKGENNPVEKVNWYDAIKYCNLCSFVEGLTPVYKINNSTNPADWGEVPESKDEVWDAASCNFMSNGYRLATDAEWEYAARGGNKSKNNEYSGSNDLNEVGWYYENSGEKRLNESECYVHMLESNESSTHPVGLKKPNEFGLYDMSGNVWEWCWDRYDRIFAYYKTDKGNNPTGPTRGSSRVGRGGSWSNHSNECRVAKRNHSYPSGSYNRFGFRLSRTQDATNVNLQDDFIKCPEFDELVADLVKFDSLSEKLFMTYDEQDASDAMWSEITRKYNIASIDMIIRVVRTGDDNVSGLAAGLLSNIAMNSELPDSALVALFEKYSPKDESSYNSFLASICKIALIGWHENNRRSAMTYCKKIGETAERELKNTREWYKLPDKPLLNTDQDVQYSQESLLSSSELDLIKLDRLDKSKFEQAARILFKIYTKSYLTAWSKDECGYDCPPYGSYRQFRREGDIKICPNCGRFLNPAEYDTDNRCKIAVKIGTALHNAGGLENMQAVASLFGNMGAPVYNLSSAWNRVGSWFD
jgi:formylglycine-generating enzyme